MANNWTHYKRDETIKEANIKIVRRTVMTQLQRESKYDVIRLCCGTSMSLSHQQIVKLIRRKITFCKKCNAKLLNSSTAIKRRTYLSVKNNEPYGVPVVKWVSPVSAIKALQGKSL